MLNIRHVEERTRPAADALRRLTRMDDALPRAGIGLSETENAFVWLARLLTDAALCPDADELSPGAVHERVNDSLRRTFGPHAASLFPLLAGGAPREACAAESPFDFRSAALDARILATGPLEWDFLGEVYGACLDRSSGQPHGQHFTPRPLGRLMTDRLFDLAEGRRFYDPAMGTGQLLVPILAKLRLRGLAAADLVESVSGSELSRVSHCLAQTNLLLQVSAADRKRGPLPSPGLLLENSLWRLGDDGAPLFDACCANPPYLGERRNKRSFDALEAEAPELRERRGPRRDLFYYFLELALERTKPGGLIVFLTTAYWLTADGAGGLREYLHSRADVVELIDFGDQRVFPTAGGVHSLIAVLRKRAEGAEPSGEELVWARLRRPGPLEDVCQALGDAVVQARATASAVESTMVLAGVGEVAKPRGPRGAWHIPAGARREEVLARIAEAGVALADTARISQGLISGADRVSRANSDRLEGAGHAVGEGVFVLEPAEVEAIGLTPESPVLRRFYKNSDIERYAVPLDAPEKYVLYLDGSAPWEELPPSVRGHLQRFRSLLGSRREVRSGGMPWWRLHWPRTEALFVGPKIVSPHRAMTNTFAFAATPFFASADVYFIWGAPSPEYFRLLTGVLNSPILDFWFAHRGKRKGSLREYYATPLGAIPVPAHRPAPASDIPRLADAAPLDEALPDRVAWSVERGDVGFADAAIARTASELIDLRGRPACLDLRHMARQIIEERRLEGILGRLTAIRYGLHGRHAWMHELVLEVTQLG